MGYGNLDKDGIIELCREHDTQDEWSYKLTDKQLGINADKWVEKINISKDRDEVLNQILEKISKEKR